MISIYFKQIYFWKKTHMYRATRWSTDHQSRISTRNTCLVHPASFTRVHCYYKRIGNAPPTYTSKIMYISDCFFVFLRLVRHDPNCVYTCEPLENIMYELSGHCRRIISKPNGWLRCAPFYRDVRDTNYAIDAIEWLKIKLIDYIGEYEQWVHKDCV